MQVTTTVNGELKQDGRTSDMVQGIAELIEYVSGFTTLLPGDVIITGTPAGVGLGMDPPRFLAAGDVVRVEIDGIGVLEQIKGSELLHNIPVVVLTTSRAEQDVQRAYLLQAACFITKPVDFECFIQAVKLIDAFWLSVVTLPCGARG